MVTGLYASLLALWLIILSTRVIALRGNPAFRWFAFGNSDHTGLERAIRAQGNLAEYAPIFLIMMLLAEMQAVAASSLHWYGMVFCLGRAMHGICFGFMRQNFFLRVGGMILTLFAMLGLATLLLIRHMA